MAVKPNLALIPSGVKASKVYSVLPSDGVGDFDFSRSGSATRINKDGLIETVASNVPRLNYPLIDGVVSGCPSLLLEPTRTNLLTYSEDFTQSYFTKTRSSILSNQVISPDGTLNADKLIEDSSANSTHYLLAPLNATAGTWTASVFLKKAERKFFEIYNFNTTLSVFNETYFDLENGVVVSGNGKIEDFGNGWYRCSLTSTLSQTSRFDFLLSKDGITDTYTGDGTSGLYIWGAQLEQGSYPTSYIPSLIGSQTTRSAETCNNSGDANTFNDSEGVLYAEISALDSNAGTERYVYIGDGTNTNRVVIRYSTTENDIRMLVSSGGSTQVSLGTTNYNVEESHKIALKYKVNDFDLWIDGVEVLTDTSGSTPMGLSELTFSITSAEFYGYMKQIQYFDKALTDTDLEELTSWQSFNEMAESQLYSIQ